MSDARSLLHRPSLRVEPRPCLNHRSRMTGHYLPRSWISPKIFLGDSKIQGRGLFARDAIHSRETVMIFGGERISRAQMESGDYRIRSIWPVERDAFIALP